MCKPGTTPSEVMEVFEKLYEKKGIRDADYQGHGIGLEPREYPIMGRGGAKTVADQVVEQDTDIPLEPDMVISLETSLYEFGRGSYEVERTYVVGKSSLEPITSDRDRSISDLSLARNGQFLKHRGGRGVRFLYPLVDFIGVRRPLDFHVHGPRKLHFF